MNPSGAELHQMASIGRLLTGIVHEINTPIGSIFCNNEVLVRSLEKLGTLLEDGTPEAIEKARRVVDNCAGVAAVDRIACERIRSVIRGLKTFARTDTSEPRRTDLNQLLRDTLKLTQAEFRKRIAVATDFGEIPPAECYPQMLSQVFLNLLVNAGQAIEGEGTITVRTRAEGGMARITIADTGRGMTPEEQAKAFDAGFTTKPVGEGTGLGLAIAREIVEDRHGGTITFASRLGAGTTFEICIPLAQTNTRSTGP